MPVDLGLTGKVAIVTGAGGSIGRGIALEFARAGAKVVINDIGVSLGGTGERSSAPAEETKAMIEALGGEAIISTESVSEWAAAKRTVEMAMDAFGRVDAVVNNAGILRTASLAEATPEIWNAVLAVNLSGAFHTMRRALPSMAERGYGRVVNIASVHGLVASVNKAPYVASKFGLVGMSRVAALEYATAGSKSTGGVTVNCICPGWTETAILAPQIEERAVAHDGDRAAGIADLLAEKQPSRRTSDPAEIGALALWLCAPIAHNVTGTSIPVDGGWTAQ